MLGVDPLPRALYAFPRTALSQMVEQPPISISPPRPFSEPPIYFPRSLYLPSLLYPAFFPPF